MTTDGIPRVPQGVSAGGQFTPVQHAESKVRLFDRPDGSFLKPSPSATAEHCIHFWSTVEIPDAIIEQVETVYMKHREAAVDKEMSEYMQSWEQAWLESNPKPRFPGQVGAWEERFTAEREEHRLRTLPTVKDARPAALGSYDSRQLIRAAQMWYHAPNAEKFPEEEKKVGAHVIELFDEDLTVDQIEAKYQLSQIHYAMSSIFKDDTDRRILAALSEVSEGINGVNNQLVDQRREF